MACTQLSLSNAAQLSRLIMGPFFWPAGKPGQPDRLSNGSCVCPRPSPCAPHFAHFVGVGPALESRCDHILCCVAVNEKSFTCADGLHNDELAILSETISESNEMLSDLEAASMCRVSFL